MHLIAQLRGSSIRVITERIAHGVLRDKDQELVVGHGQTELRVDVIVGLGSLVTGTAGTVEGRARVDTRGGDVAAVLARNRVAGAALGRRWVGQGQSGRGQDCQEGELHCVMRSGMVWYGVIW